MRAVIPRKHLALLFLGLVTDGSSMACRGKVSTISGCRWGSLLLHVLRHTLFTSSACAKSPLLSLSLPDCILLSFERTLLLLIVDSAAAIWADFRWLRQADVYNELIPLLALRIVDTQWFKGWV